MRLQAVEDGYGTVKMVFDCWGMRVTICAVTPYLIMTQPIRVLVCLAALALLGTGVSCDSHSWEETKKLYGHGDKHHAKDGADHGDGHGSKEAAKKDH